jgi:carboxymethylenebutenolidase
MRLNVLAVPMLAAVAWAQAPVPALPEGVVMEANIAYDRYPETRLDIVRPKAPTKGKRPGVLVVHEWWGLDDWIKQQASKLADAGYAALAIDLYRGKTASTPDLAHELMRGLPDDRAARDLKSAFEYLAAQKSVDPKRIGTIGWCMGGGYALNLALDEPRTKAAVINYGHLATEPSRLQRTNTAFLGIFGAMDRGIPVSDVRAFERELKTAGKKIEVVIYPDAGHAFENPNNKSGYRAADPADAWSRTMKFLETNLK